jgi:hypothetical protein
MIYSSGERDLSNTGNTIYSTNSLSAESSLRKRICSRGQGRVLPPVIQRNEIGGQYPPYSDSFQAVSQVMETGFSWKSLRSRWSMSC